MPGGLGYLPFLNFLAVNDNNLTGTYPTGYENLCIQLNNRLFKNNKSISDDNNFYVEWEDFCSNQNSRIGNFIDFSIYPNPASSKVTIKFESEDVGVDGFQRSISIYDVAGKSYLSQSFHTTSDKTIELDVHNFPKGIYVVEMNYGDYLSTQKLVIQ